MRRVHKSYSIPLVFTRYEITQGAKNLRGRQSDFASYIIESQKRKPTFQRFTQEHRLNEQGDAACSDPLTPNLLRATFSLWLGLYVCSWKRVSLGLEWVIEFVFVNQWISFMVYASKLVPRWEWFVSECAHSLSWVPLESSRLWVSCSSLIPPWEWFDHAFRFSWTENSQIQ